MMSQCMPERELCSIETGYTKLIEAANFYIDRVGSDRCAVANGWVGCHCDHRGPYRW